MTGLFRLYCRWRHTCGYGIHSPFAFRLITEAIHPSCGYCYYSELDPGMSPLQRIRFRVGIFMRSATGLAPTENLEEWMNDPSTPLMIISPGEETAARIEQRLRDEGCGLLIGSRRYIIAIARNEMAFVKYEIL